MVSHQHGSILLEALAMEGAPSASKQMGEQEKDMEPQQISFHSTHTRRPPALLYPSQPWAGGRVPYLALLGKCSNTEAQRGRGRRKALR